MRHSRQSAWLWLLSTGLLVLTAGRLVADEPKIADAPARSSSPLGVRLSKLVEVKFEKLALAEALRQLAEQAELITQWDAAVDMRVKEAEVTLQASGIRAGTLLQELLERHSLTVRLEKDALIIVNGVPAGAQADEYFPRPSQAEAKILQALDNVSTVEFNETPLGEALQQLVKDRDVNLVSDAAALTKTIREANVTLAMKEARLSSILKTMLRDQDLTYIIDDDALRITTPLIAGSQYIVRTYPVGDLLTTPDELKSLIQSVEKTVDLATWERQGGEGNIAAANNSKSLIVSQTWHGHQKILELLRVLRQAKGVR